MSHIAITGGCGFLGTWILRRLLAEDHQITVLDLERMTRRWEMVLSPEQIGRVAFRPLRVEQAEQVIEAIAELAPDAVIHLAALQVPACKADPLTGARVNVLGTLAVFEACAALNPIPRVIFAASSAVYGSDEDYGGAAVDDQSPPRPRSHYGAYKVCNEMCARVHWLDKKLPSVAFRPLTIYGPGRDVGLTSYPTRAVLAALRGESFEIPFRGPTTYIYVEEVADYFVEAALEASGGARVYAVGGDSMDVPAFIAAVEEVLPDARGRITCSGGDLPIASDVRDPNLRKAYPQVERVALKEGLRRTIEVFKTLAQRGELPEP